MIQYFKKKIDSKLVLILATFYAVTLSISFAKKSYFKFNGLEYTKTSWSDLFINYFILDYIVIMIFISLATLTTKMLIDKKLNWKLILVIHFSLSISLSFFINIVSALFLITIGKLSFSQIKVYDYLNAIMQVLDVNFLSYFSMVLIIYTFYYIKKNKEVEIEATIIKTQLTSAKLNLLKSNLQPHFLFNTLNSISALVDINKKQAQNTIADLGHLLRELLDVGNKNLISLQQELDMLVRYINIIEVRFSDHFLFTSDIDDELLDCSVLSLLLQPIIENSIKHGYDYETTDLEVHLSIEKENDRILILISNNGKLLEKDFALSEKNIGIKNTLERLKTTYNNDYQYLMKNKSDKSGVITYISIPYIG